MTTSSSDSIAEKVRFWEEQDKINQELIPRVIRQNELLTKHIAEHDSLPEVAGNGTKQLWMLPKSRLASKPEPASRKPWMIFKRCCLTPKPNSASKPKLPSPKLWNNYRRLWRPIKPN